MLIVRQLLRAAKRATPYSLPMGLRLTRLAIGVAARFNPTAKVPCEHKLTKEMAARLLGLPEGAEPDPQAFIRLQRGQAWTQHASFCLRMRMTSGDLESAKRTIDWRNLDRLMSRHASGKPVVIVGWHMASFFLANNALMMTGLRVVKITVAGGKGGWPDDWILLRWDHTKDNGAAHLKSALRAVRSGAVAFLMPDITVPAPSSAIRTLLGRPSRYAKGFATLAELTGADVLPISARWNDSKSRLIVELQEPLRRDLPGLSAEESLLEDYVARQTKFILDHPDQAQIARFRKIDASFDPGAASKPVREEDEYAGF